MNNYQEAKQAKLTNLMLSECRRTQNPDDLYHTIKTGHVALLCFVISEYSRQEIERQDQVDSKRFFESSLEKLMGEIRGASTLIKEKAKSVQDDLRWRMGEADEGKDKDKEKAEIG